MLYLKRQLRVKASSHALWYLDVNPFIPVAAKNGLHTSLVSLIKALLQKYLRKCELDLYLTLPLNPFTLRAAKKGLTILDVFF